MMKFPYQKLPAEPLETHPDRKNILRPVIPVHIISGNKRIGYAVLIDSGADYCIFHAGIGEVIGLDVKNAKQMIYSGIGGVKQTAYFHHVTIEIGGYEHPYYAGFSYDIETLPYGILGQNDFFSYFIIIFDKEKGRIELKQRTK